MKIYTSTLTNTRNDENKDSFYIGKDWFVVCDGISSTASGGRAARYVTNHCKKYEYFEEIEDFKDFMEPINSKIRFERGGTTFTAVVLEKDGNNNKVVGIKLIHTGDSECYIINNNSIDEITYPFTLAKVRFPNLSKKELDETRMNNVLIEYLGMDELPDFQIENFSKPEYLIICSDGANCVEPDEMKNIVLSDYKNPAETIAEKSRKNGSSDDITVIVVKL